MKTHLDIKHAGTLGNDDRTRMTFDENSIAHLMSVLTDLYSNPALAVIREYSTNALDSHRAAGNPDPIEVTLPNAMEPTFVVRDHGVGMSVDEITSQFSKYGWSSKRETDDEVGMLGLGCKSALSYTSQFTLVAVKDGVQATVLVTRDSDGCGALQVIDTVGTDEPNGVEVQVPVRDMYSFIRHAEDFFQYWEPGLVLIDGKVHEFPIGTNEADLVLDPDVILSRTIGTDVVVMGNVPYPLPLNVAPLLPLRNGRRIYNAVVRVPIGAVNFTPSREALHMTKRTTEVVDEARQFIAGALHRRAQADIDDAPSFREALDRTERWRDVFWSVYKYRGYDVPERFDCDPDRTLHWNRRYTREGARALKTSHIKIEEALKSFHVVGYRARGLRAETKEKLRAYLEENDVQSNIVYLYEKPIDDLGWFGDDVGQVSYDVIKAIDLGTSTTARLKAGEYRTAGGSPATEITTRPLLWINREDVMAQHQRDAVHEVSRLAEGVAIVVNKQNSKRFHNEYPDAEHVRDYVERDLKERAARFSPELALLAHDPYQWTHTGFDNLKPDQLRDAELARIIRGFKRVDVRPHIEVHQWRSMERCARAINASVPELPWKRIAGRLEALTKMYPMVSSVRPHYTQEIEAAIEYVNAIYIVRNQLHLHPSTY